MSVQSAKNQEIILDLIDKKLDDMADTIYNDAIQQLLDDGKTDTSFLMQTAYVERNYLQKRVVFPAEYASVVNDGRAAGKQMPPPQELYGWVRRKLGVRGEQNIKKTAF